MGTKVDGKKILEKLVNAKNDRQKVSLYLSKGLYDTFKEACDKRDTTASKVMDELMKEFLTSIGVKIP